MSDDDRAHRWFYDLPGTLAGDLQTGHGLGAAKVSERPQDAADLVFSCIRRDHRWWWRVDDRPDYLARQVRLLEMDPTPIVDLLYAVDDPDDDPDNTFDLALDVLVALGYAGDEQVVRALRYYVNHGPHWRNVLPAVAGRWPRRLWDDLDGVALARLGPAHEDGPAPYGRPWTDWAPRHERVAALLRRREARPQAPARESSMSTDRLLAVLADGAEPSSAKRNALRELAFRGSDPRLLDLAGELHGVPGLTDAVEALGPAAVGHARAWAAADRLHRLGVTVVAAHGTEHDVPLLIDAWDRLFRSDDWCGFDIIADGLARFGQGSAEAAGRLRMVIRQTPHSYERTACLRALLAIAPARARGPLQHALLDCEPDVRELAVAHAPDTAFTRKALAEIRDDPLAARKLRNTAAARLATL
ncbi:hypothetical protein [Catellatospora sp. NPDC049609]|uniref:hypothetical protein n=1 Tax=Catellatospora sp. NPDC049609 TaxID=3155505 RepID=UPI00341F922E